MPEDLLRRERDWCSATALILCCLFPAQALIAQVGPSSPVARPTSEASAQIQPSELDPQRRILHLLSRFTFGPTQQDLAFFDGIGTTAKKPDRRQLNRKIDQWFDQQLEPDRIPDPKLDARLTEFPALQLPVDELLTRFPSNAIIRQTANGKLAMPQDPYLAAVYSRHIQEYEDKQAKKATAQDSQPGAMAKPAQPTAAMEPPKGVAASQQAQTHQVSATMTSSTTGTGLPRSKAAGSRPSYDELLVKSVLAMSPDQRIERILDMPSGQYEQLRAGLKGPLKTKLFDGMDSGEREYLSSYDNPTRTVVEEMQAQRLLRDIYSSRQLQEVMTTFWLNHFNIYLHKDDEEPYYLAGFERDVIRPRALGNFEDLLVAVAQSPAMLLYLDNSSSTGPDSPAAEKQKERAAKGKAGKAAPQGLNENYARELMELHTLGVNGGYTQQDVTEVAKVFTGWTVDKPQLGGAFKFDESRHEPGKKVVLGRKIKDNGEKEGLQLLHTLATSPATARFISRELAIAFVSDNPPQALVNRMAKTFLDEEGDIPSVLKTMLHSPEFWAPEAYHAKVKTPLEYVVSAARASGADVHNAQPLINALNQMGMPLYACVPPTGYSAKAEDWISTGALVTRMNFGLSLATNHYPEIQTTWNLLVSSPASKAIATDSLASAADAELAIEERLIPSGVSDKTRSAILSQASEAVQQKPSPPKQKPPLTVSQATPEAQAEAAQQAAKTQAAILEKRDAQLAGLLLGSPEFQRR